MDARERYEDLQTALRAAHDGLQARLWTALPATVVSFDADAQTITAQPTVRVPQVSSDGTVTRVMLPHLLDVPVVFPHGGGFNLTFPLQAGDEVLVVFASRCVDGWWQLGGVQVAPDPRMHDLSDGFAIPGPRSQVTVIPGVSTTDVQLRSDDGATSISIAPSGTVTIMTAADLDIGTAGDLEADVNGSVVVTTLGDLTAEVGGNLLVHATGTGSVSSTGPLVINSATSINLTGPPSSIKANGNVLG